jgi:SAM-dependent methyltransferase
MAAIAEGVLVLNAAPVALASEGRRIVRLALGVEAPIVFHPHFRVSVGGFESDSVHTLSLAWLPRGKYRIDLLLPDSLPAGPASIAFDLRHNDAMQDVSAGVIHAGLVVPGGTSGVRELTWSVESLAPTPPLASLSWRRGHSDWFYRHFDHAASIVMSYILGDSPLLKGRILDVGCGDGITDLGIALRTGCTELIGVDPFKGFERLPGIVTENGLPPDILPPNLRFMPVDANHLPFPDDSFDVVISWGSVEHMAGGYHQALLEVRRVLKPGGLFFVAPGLFYSNIGHHLDEFSDEPFFHLKRSREELRKMVLDTPPKYIDRSGEFASNEQYWQWFTELNPITVTEFEKELRALDFQPWRVALRTIPLVEYTPEIESYAIETLANTELYMSCVSRKTAPGGAR